MQAVITGINVNPSKQTEIQLSSNNYISQTTSQISFSDYLTKANDDLNDSTKFNQESFQSEDAYLTENNVDKADVKTSETVENSKIEENQQSHSDNQVETTEKSTETNEKNQYSEEISDLNKKKNNDDNVLIDSSKKLDESIKDKKSQKNSKIQKEDLDEDFRRINQLVEESKIQEPVDNLEKIAVANNEKQFVNKSNSKEKSDENISIQETNSINPVLKEGEEVLFSGNVKKSEITKLDSEGKISVKDFRTEVKGEKESDNNDLNLNNKSADIKTTVQIDSKDSATITLDMPQNVVENNTLSLNSQTAASQGSNFQAMVANQIQASVPEFVKTGTIILKDNNQGTINLILHPEEIGSIKVHLTLDGNNISGQITVNTKEALEVFKENAQTLREAFVNNGFESANFELSYSGNENSGQNKESFNQFSDNNFYGRKTYNNIDSVNNVDSLGFENIDEIFSNNSINIVA